MLFLSGDCSAVQLGQPGLPGVLADLGLDADHVGRGLQPVHRHHHLSGRVLAKVRNKESLMMFILMLIKLIMQWYNLSSGQSNYDWNLGQWQKR